MLAGMISWGWAWVLAQNCPQMEWRNPLPHGLVYHSLVKFQGRYFAGSADGTVLVSLDFMDWTRLEVGFSNWHKIIEAENQLVMVGESSRIATSTDGISWDIHVAMGGPAITFSNVAFGGGKYVAVGTGGFVATSTDAIAWTVHTTPAPNWLTDVGFYEGMFYATGYPGILMESPDGISWTTIPTGTMQQLNTVCGDNAGTIVAAGYGGVVLVNQGMGWNTVMGLSSSLGIEELIFDGTQYVGITQTIGVVRSSDFVNWPGVTMVHNRDFEDISFDGIEYLIGGFGGQHYRSVDAINWEAGSEGWKNNIDCMVSDGQKLILGSRLGSILVTDNGTDFTTQNVPGVDAIISGHWAEGLWVMGSSSGKIVTSEDGVNWSAPVNFGAAVRNIAKGPDWIAVGNGGTVQLSSDGLTWNPVTPFTSDVIFGLAVNGSAYHVGTNTGAMFTSDDGTNWVPSVSPTTASISGIRVIDGNLFVFGQQGSWRSSDGVNWFPTGLGGRVHELIKDAHTYYAGSDFYVATSSDGWTWNLIDYEPDVLALNLASFNEHGLLTSGLYGSVLHVPTVGQFVASWVVEEVNVLQMVELVTCYHPPFVVD
ncbi:MAG: hypothetical protein KDC35_17695 [Acidobacteria bacterium]|nr:hypothetical protein [Acidobacteriota bacterium]